MIRRLFCALLLCAPGLGFAVDRATCTMIERLLKNVDAGLASAASGKSRFRPASGITTMATEALRHAERFEKTGALPEPVTSALTTIAEAAEQHSFIAPAAPDLLKHGLVVQAAMPKLCPDIKKLPDLARHGL